MGESMCRFAFDILNRHRDMMSRGKADCVFSGLMARAWNASSLDLDDLEFVDFVALMREADLEGSWHRSKKERTLTSWESLSTCSGSQSQTEPLSRAVSGSDDGFG